jgi:hypothetical protein
MMALRRPKRRLAAKKPVPTDTEREGALPEPPTVRQARRRLRAQLRALGNGASSDGATLGPDPALALALREYLISELPALNPGDTARDIRRHVQTTVPEGTRKEALDALAARLVAYQDGLERGMPVADSNRAEEEQLIESLLGRLHAQARFIDSARRVMRRS